MKGRGDTGETLTAEHREATPLGEVALAEEATVAVDAASVTGQEDLGLRSGSEVRSESLDRAVRREVLLGERQAALTRRRARGVQPRRLPVPRQGVRESAGDDPSVAER